jgi:hypothetical protein
MTNEIKLILNIVGLLEVSLHSHVDTQNETGAVRQLLTTVEHSNPSYVEGKFRRPDSSLRRATAPCLIRIVD